MGFKRLGIGRSEGKVKARHKHKNTATRPGSSSVVPPGAQVTGHDEGLMKL